MALGCSAYSITRQLNKINLTVAGKRILAVLELVCYLLVLRYAVTGVDPKYSFVTLFIMCVGLILTFSDVNPCHRVFDKPVFGWCGKMSLLPLKVVLCILTTFVGALICDKVVAFFIKTKPFTKLMIEGEGE